MNRSEQEQLRHDIFVEALKNADSTDKLPAKIQPSTIVATLIPLASTKEKRIAKEDFDEVYRRIVFDSNYLNSDEFILGLSNILKKNYPNYNDNEINEKINEILNNARVKNLIFETLEYEKKYNELLYKEMSEAHDELMGRMDSTRMIEDLPKIGIGDINRLLQKDFYELFKKEKLRVEFTGNISKALLNGESINSKVINDAITYLCQSKEMIEPYNSMSLEDKINYVSEIISKNFEIKFLVEEINKKEQQTLKIYELDHDDIMDNIKDATRISQMPPNLSISRISSYLSDNSLIYSKGLVIPGGEFIEIAEALLNGKKISDDEVKEMLKTTVAKYYHENTEEAYNLLFNKLSKLPKLDYYVEEVRYGIQRQQEFIARGASNVNVYFIPNPKSPIEGGKFYNVYINRASNLNLEEILPLDLESIVPPEMDIDSVEWYVQQHADPTFKTAGGIILNKDESIGGVSIFKPSDGKVGITPEEKTRYEKLEELSKRLKEITDISKKAKEEFLKSQAIIDEQISTIQDEMSLLIDEDEKGRV